MALQLKAHQEGHNLHTYDRLIALTETNYKFIELNNTSMCEISSIRFVSGFRVQETLVVIHLNELKWLPPLRYSLWHFMAFTDTIFCAIDYHRAVWYTQPLACPQTHSFTLPILSLSSEDTCNNTEHSIRLLKICSKIFWNCVQNLLPIFLFITFPNNR